MRTRTCPHPGSGTGSSAILTCRAPGRYTPCMSVAPGEHPSVAHDLFEPGAARAPAELRANSVARGDEDRRITCPPIDFVHCNISVGNGARDVDDLADRIARTVAEVVHAMTRLSRRVEREEMSSGEVVDMDVVAHGGAVARR